jgi:enoyl-CoA hydratase/carnithine racemase
MNSKLVIVLKEEKGETRCGMSEKDLFKVEQDGHIAWLTLNRPDHRNNMGLAFFKELQNILNGLTKTRVSVG